MKYKKIIEAINREVNLKNQFTDYGFQQVLGIKCPNPSKIEWLNTQFSDLMERLTNYLKSDPNKEGIEQFIIEQVSQLDTSGYLKEEFKQLILNYNGIIYFSLGSGVAKTYYDQNEGRFEYFE